MPGYKIYKSNNTLKVTPSLLLAWPLLYITVTGKVKKHRISNASLNAMFREIIMFPDTHPPSDFTSRHISNKPLDAN